LSFFFAVLEERPKRQTKQKPTSNPHLMDSLPFYVVLKLVVKSPAPSSLFFFLIKKSWLLVKFCFLIFG
jgi:hypothetical protein